MAPAASLRTLLAGAIDYAGLFPPAKLGMRAAVEQYARHRRGEEAWALGRFVLPVARLGELAAERRDAAVQDSPWRLSVLLGDDPTADAARIREFNDAHGQVAVVDSAEAKVPAAGEGEVASLAASIPPSLTLFIEIVVDRDISPLVRAIGSAGAGAKIRTGGVTAELFPSAANVIRFIRCCAEEDVPFKATAGLHHPMRGSYRLTYEPDAPSGMMYGFLNLLVASASIRAGCSNEQAIAILTSEDAGAFRFDDDGVRWGDCALATRQLRDSRTRFVLSFGSCSYDEPLAGLRHLSLL